ncbi:cupin domain-containing protein [Nitrincola tibetensis]|uniref:Cupin domain-containing protein n=1 Tax=Nitrincola tibetensis TaxID=2219697 RepID=A0A364NQ73_9GAMM|nr:cupin domain-containing protein [Nitrincola tibetensis]RAU19258.1 cupin domain-containing protein [Nitrincola tibetensis]
MTPNYPLGNMSAEEFLRDYWQKKPLVIRNALAEMPPPIEPDELAGLACEEDVESRLISFNPSLDQWSMRHGPFSDEDFAQLPPSGWTLLVQGVDHWSPEANALLRRFSFVPNWRVDDLMISYATDGGGVGPHYDNYDVFLIQVKGKRRWEVGGLFDEHSPRREDAPVMILPEWEAQESYVLEPGDILYLPPRVGHNGIAIGDDCMTCSVGFRAPAHHEILRSFTDYIGERLGHDARYSDPDLTLQTEPGEISHDALNKVRATLLECLDQPDLLAKWFGEWITEPKYPLYAETDADPFSLDDIRAFLEEGGVLAQNEGSRYSFIESETVTHLFVDGKHYALDTPDSRRLAKRLCHPEPLLGDDVNAADAQSVTLLSDLILANSLYSQDDLDASE